MRLDVVVTEPADQEPGVEVTSDGVNPVQLSLRHKQRVYMAQLAPEDARRLARALELAAEALDDPGSPA